MEKSHLLDQYAKTSQRKKKLSKTLKGMGRRKKLFTQQTLNLMRKRNHTKKVNEVKDIVNRMYNGRKFREQRNEYQERGYKKEEIPK